MPSRRTSTAHQEVVSRRLAQLADQLANERGPTIPEEDDDWWSPHTRVAEARAPLALVPDAREPVAVPVSAPTPVLVPDPGRHASRRSGLAMVDLLPETLRGRVRLGPAQLAVVAVLVALGLAVTAWWAVRGHPATPMPATAPASALVDATAPTSGPTPAVAPTPSATAPGSGGAAAKVTVDVAGKVRHPGIVVLTPGSRVVDAVHRAGGARPGVDLTLLNLARELVDGEQILVGVTSPTFGAAGAPSTSDSPTGTTPTTLVDLNLASETELESLPDVGPVTAGSIISWRDAHGAFTAVSDLLEVDGIGEVTLAKLTPLVTV